MSNVFKLLIGSVDLYRLSLLSHTENKNVLTMYTLPDKEKWLHILKRSLFENLKVYN